MSADGTATLPADLQHVHIAAIRVVPGRNPRRYFDTAMHQQLVASVRVQGVIQPVTLRPADDGTGFMEMVAGERRLRAAIEVGLEEIPAVIRSYTEAQAVVVAQIENQEREGLSVTDEVLSARKAIDVANGDRAEAARILGWSRKRLDMRMLLVHAEPYVLDAASAKRIALGHAELISTLAPDAQRTVFDLVLKHGSTVETLRTQLASFTQDLKAARFDTAGCQDCPHNSATQASLFEFHVGAGRCSNKPCWNSKVEVFLDVRRRELATEHNVVFLDRDKAEGNHTPLLADGARGVGQDQIDTGCKGCINCGVMLSTVPGREGTPSAATCFDLTCHTQKAHVYREAQAEQEETEEESATDQQDGTASDDTPSSPQSMQAESAGDEESPEPTPGRPVKAPSTSSKKPAATAKKTAKKAKVQVKGSASASPKAVADFILADLCNLAVEHAADDPAVVSVLTLYALQDLAGISKGTTIKAAALLLFAMTPEQRADEQRKAIVKLLQHEPSRFGTPDYYTGSASLSAQALKATGKTLAEVFKVSRAFLQAHTKSGIDAVLNEAEFWRVLAWPTEAEKKKALHTLMTGKTSDIIDTVLNSEHDFTGFVPESVDTAFRKLTEGK